MKNMVNTNRPVSIIGLGQMGKKLAQLLIDNRIPVTVWNRSIDKARDLGHVEIADSAASAFAAAELVVLCVYNYEAINEIINHIYDKSILLNKTIINLTTGDPVEASELAAMISAYGGKYVDGAIQVAPEEMGKPGTTILVSGDEPAFQDAKSILEIFGGNLKYLGATPTAANSMDLATLAWLYGSFTGLIHGAALAENAGIDLQVYADIIAEITPGFTTFFQHELSVIKNREYSISQSPLSISVPATRRIREAMESAGISSDFHHQVEKLLNKADESGYGNEELAAIIKVLRKNVN